MIGRKDQLWTLLLMAAIGVLLSTGVTHALDRRADIGSRPGTAIDFAQASGGGGAREIPFAVTVDSAPNQIDPTSLLPVEFEIDFAVAIDPTTFTVADIIQTGTATGITWELVDSGDGRNFILRATAVTGSGTLEPMIPAGVVNDLMGNENLVSIGNHNDVAFAPPPACPSKTYLYMGLWSTPKLYGYCVDNATGILTEQFQMNVDEDVRDLAISDGNLYFAHRDITKYSIDPVDGCVTEVAKTPIASGDIDDILIDAPGARLYASHHNGRLYVVDLEADPPEVIQVAEDPIGPHGIALNADGDQLYVANQWSFLGDPPDAQEIAQYPVLGTGLLDLDGYTSTEWDAEPDYLVLHPDPAKPYLYHTTRPLGKVRKSDVSLSPATEGAPAVFSGFGATRLVINDAGDRLYVTNNIDDTLNVFELDADGEIVEPALQNVAAGDHPEDVLLHPNGDFIFIASHGDDLGLSRVLVYRILGDGTLAVAATATVPGDIGAYRLAIVDLGP